MPTKPAAPAKRSAAAKTPAAPAKKSAPGALTPEVFLAGLPADRRDAVAALRATILANLPPGYEEAIAWGMLTYQVPLAVYPDTYNKKPLMYAALASQKGYMALYLCNVYGDPALRERFVAGFAAAGKRLDMGKSCVRFKALADLPMPVVAQAIAATPMADYIAFARAQHGPAARAARREARAQG